MTVDIKTTNDELFQITTVKFGGQHMATDGERVAIGVTEELAVEAVQEMQAQNVAASNAAPLENSRDGHPFDPFGGTSWAGKRDDFN